MRRKKDNKQVLRRGNGRDNKKNRRIPISFNRNKTRDISYNSRKNSWNKPKKQKKRSRKTVFIMILILVAFIIGAGSGVLLSFDDGSGDNQTHVKNVTVEMTTGLNESGEVIFNDSDHVDYNENSSSAILDAENNPYYNVSDPDH